MTWYPFIWIISSDFPKWLFNWTQTSFQIFDTTLNFISNSCFIASNLIQFHSCSIELQKKKKMLFVFVCLFYLFGIEYNIFQWSSICHSPNLCESNVVVPSEMIFAKSQAFIGHTVIFVMKWFVTLLWLPQCTISINKMYI